MKHTRAVRLTAVISACMAISACLDLAGYNSKSPNTFVVTYDEGGWIQSYDKQIVDFRIANTAVEVRGFCASACTMYMSLPDFCVSPKSRMAFHGSIPLAPGEIKSEGDWMMARHYSPALREWYYANASHLILTFKSLTGQQLHDRFGYRLC